MEAFIVHPSLINFLPCFTESLLLPGYDYMAYMDYMDLAVRYPQKGH